ncbi:MAG: hypothetical protein M1840_002703 [Geoglossum simile]|nr:MAG: hypothetical protein M1840_002703 [Geoglossum simile]
MGSPRRSTSPEYVFDEEEVKPLVIDYDSVEHLLPKKKSNIPDAGFRQIDLDLDKLCISALRHGLKDLTK